MEEPHDEAQSLASLPAAVLHHIIGSLHTQADQRRLAASCCRLRALCAQAVHTLVLSQHVSGLQAPKQRHTCIYHY